MTNKCLNFEKNKSRCNCTYEPCSRKGTCCECLFYHLRMKELPACFFTVEAEASCDRSFEKFISLYGKK